MLMSAHMHWWADCKPVLFRLVVRAIQNKSQIKSLPSIASSADFKIESREKKISHHRQSLLILLTWRGEKINYSFNESGSCTVEAKKAR